MIKVAQYADTFSSERYTGILKGMVSYKLLKDFFRLFPNHIAFISKYYNEISNLDFYRKNHFFWLQYAIACIELHQFERALEYLKGAHGLAPKGSFVPFQITTQEARLYLERIACGDSPDVMSDIDSADAIFAIPCESAYDDEKNVISLFHYYISPRFTEKFADSSEKRKQICHCISNAIRRTQSYLPQCPVYDRDCLNSLVLDLEKVRLAICEE